MIYIYLTNLFNFIVCAILTEKYLHILQLKDYKNIRFFRFFKKKLYIFAIYLLFFVFFIINYLFFNDNLIFNINLNLALIFINAIFSTLLIKTNKTPIKYTPRTKRLFAITIILLVIINAIPNGVILTCFTMIALVPLANTLNIVDKMRNKRFIKTAREKVRLNKTRIIAITGSNGKTSVKNILYAMLSKKYKTQMTPKSYNTELGISKFINDNLSEDTEFLILEYGARQRGDIKRLCELFGADFGIITSVAPQHLETFRSIENVCKTKRELSDYLGGDLCIFNLDNDFARMMYQEKIGKKLGISIERESDICAKNIKIVDGKTNFDLIVNNHTYNISTNLLGRHNVTNILLSTALANHLDVDTKSIIESIENLAPIPHRLEYIKSHINILDDTYNCSLSSASEAIWTLSQMPKSHIVATPGIIEGGKEQYNINFELGKMLANVDQVIIIGKTNIKAIVDGLKSQNFDRELILAHDLEEAKTHFSRLKKGGTLLLLNDLPDDYN